MGYYFTKIFGKPKALGYLCTVIDTQYGKQHQRIRFFKEIS